MKLTINLKKATDSETQTIILAFIRGDKLTIEEYDKLVQAGCIKRNPLTRGAGKPYKSIPKVKK